MEHHEMQIILTRTYKCSREAQRACWEDEHRSQWAIGCPSHLDIEPLPEIRRLRGGPKGASSGICCGETAVGFPCQAFIDSDRSEVNPGAKEAEELGSFPGNLNFV